jgi:heat shock protein HslJ
MANHGSQKQSNIQAYFWLILPLVLAVILASCQPTPAPNPPPTSAPTSAPASPEPTSVPTVNLDEVYNQLWVLVGYGPQDSPLVVEQGTVITAQFTSDGTVSGSSGCNSYSGTVEIAPDGTLTVPSPFISTMMACESGMDQEQAYLAALGSAQTLSINDQGRLVISYGVVGDNQALVFTQGETPLAGTLWTLVGYGDPSGLSEVEAGTTITAVFDEQDITGSAGCNSYTASYSTQDGQISVGPAATTRMACPAGMDQETAYLEALQQSSTYQVLGQQLTLSNEAGDGALIFTAASLPLENILWTLVDANGQEIPADLGLTALFQSSEEANMGTVAGSAGCNNYTAGYTLDGDQISISAIASTFKFCETGMDVEQSYLTLLQGAQSYRILGRTLELTTADGALTYVADRTPLQGALWVLTGIGDPEQPQGPVDGANFTAQFNRSPNAPTGVLAGTTGCTEYSTAYAASLTEIKINPPQSGDSSSCSAPVQAQTAEYFDALSQATTYTIIGNVLRIPYGEDSSKALLFTGTQLEVAGQLPLSELNGTTWFLEIINDQTLVPGSEINSTFNVDPNGESGTMNGSAGCNAYSATFGLDLGVVATLTGSKVCTQPAGVMEQEQSYINALNRAYGYWLTGDRLIVNTGLGALTYSKTRPNSSLDQTFRLQNKTWFLWSYGDQDSVAGNAEPSIFFNADGTVSGNTGCNALTGNYTTAVLNISFNNLLVGSSTCPDDASNQQQQAMVAALNSSQTYQVVQNTMQIVATSGVLNFSTTPPDRVAPVPPPTAVINGPTEAQVGETVTFDGSGSSSTAAVSEYRWNFNDGTVVTGVTVQHAYSTPGTYEVVLRVFDELEQVGRATQNITITEAPTPEQTPPSAVATGSTSGYVAEPVAFSGTNSTPGSSPIATYAWDFGNGSSSPPSPDPNTSTLYDKSGAYNVVLTVTDQNGLSSNASLSVVIDARLEGPVWVYHPAVPLLPGTAITLQFESGMFVGFSGCNTYQGSYTSTVNEDGSYSITVNGINQTQIACPPDVMEQEQDYIQALETARVAVLQGNVLTLTTGSGDLTFYEAGSPTPR